MGATEEQISLAPSAFQGQRAETGSRLMLLNGGREENLLAPPPTAPFLPGERETLLRCSLRTEEPSCVES